MVRTRKVALHKYRKLKSAVGENKERTKESNAKQVTLRGITKSATHSKLRVTFCGSADKCFHSLLIVRLERVCRVMLESMSATGTKVAFEDTNLLPKS